ncbi:hypothetical protein C8F04DRAFT_1304506 [Mycena alexandri]|uniref:Uncharacterized protein n=1 Tax=Mycena alexandri TaxID=1745969 RepID=A0AAD6S9L6_9AGAR|nr:hypothetical protein C8F04DRAFT_1304506 [Mycena alexandri]
MHESASACRCTIGSTDGTETTEKVDTGYELEKLRLRVVEIRTELRLAHDLNQTLVSSMKDREAWTKANNGHIQESLECHVCLTTLYQPDVFCLINWFETATKKKKMFTCPGCRGIVYTAPVKNIALRNLLSTLVEISAVEPVAKKLDPETPDPYSKFFFDDTEMGETDSDEDDSDTIG